MQRQAAQLQRHGLEQLIGAGQHPRSQRPGDHDLHRAEPPAHQPGAVGHIQHHKAVQEAEPVGDHIGKMEAVPDEIQLPDDKADVENSSRITAQHLSLRLTSFAIRYRNISRMLKMPQ